MRKQEIIFPIMICMMIVIFLIALILFNRNTIENFETIEDVHKKLRLKGDFGSELPEQKMILKHIDANDKILELGPNIGRSSIIANYKLKDKNQHLCVETIEDYCKDLKENRDLNNMKFQIFNGAISNTPLYQSNWRCSSEYKEGYKKVNTKPLEYVLNKYKIKFDTIIADCEGCVVQLFKDNERFLNQIKKIILEHDFNNKEDLNYYNNLMKKYKFKMIDKVMKKDVGLENWEDGVISDPIFVSVWKK